MCLCICVCWLCVYVCGCGCEFKQVHPSGQIAVLDSQCPWKSHLFDLEAEFPAAPKLVYIVYGDTSGGWYVLAVHGLSLALDVPWASDAHSQRQGQGQ